MYPSMPLGRGVCMPACNWAGVVTGGVHPPDTPPHLSTSGRYASYWNAFLFHRCLSTGGGGGERGGLHPWGGLTRGSTSRGSASGEWGWADHPPGLRPGVGGWADIPGSASRRGLGITPLPRN